MNEINLRIADYAAELGIQICKKFDPRLLAPSEKIRGYCLEDKCNNYGKNYTCPPFIGTVEEHRNRLKNYQCGFILQYSRMVDVRNDRKGVEEAKNYFHRSVLSLEKLLTDDGIKGVWGMAGGNCGLCEPCEARLNRPCLYPGEARTSLEAIAVDVLGLLESQGLDNRFHADRITWTGCILY